TAIAIPLAIAMTVLDDAHAQPFDGLRAPVEGPGQQPVTAQPSAMTSRSGIDIAAMDKSANACSDFYQFACGGWIAKHPTPPDQPRYGRFDELQDRNNEILHLILQDAMDAGASADADTQKIGDYFQSCMSDKAIESKGLAPLEADI